MPKLRKAPSETIRAAVTIDGRPPHRIALDAKVSPAILSRFLSRQRGLSSRSMDRLAIALGYELRPVSRPT
jgi:hypothetical protein